MNAPFTAKAVQLVAEQGVDPLKVFRVRSWARAHLWHVGEYTLHDAVDVLQAAAQRDGIVEQYGQEKVQTFLAATFARFQEPPPQ